MKRKNTGLETARSQQVRKSVVEKKNEWKIRTGKEFSMVVGHKLTKGLHVNRKPFFCFLNVKYQFQHLMTFKIQLTKLANKGLLSFNFYPCERIAQSVKEVK